MTPKSSNANRARVVDLLGLVVRQPRTLRELCGLTGLEYPCAGAWLDLMVEEGLILKHPKPDHRGPGNAPGVYTWVGAPK